MRTAAQNGRHVHSYPLWCACAKGLDPSDLQTYRSESVCRVDVAVDVDLHIQLALENAVITSPCFRLHALAAAALVCTLGSKASAQTSMAAEPGRLADVIITAQKVAQPVGKAALSIAAIGGGELRTLGATNATALTTLMPNVQSSSGSAGSTDISIRGIVSTNTTEVGDPEPPPFT